MTRTVLACIGAWFIPGAGHFYLGKWRRAIVFCLVVLTLFGFGIYMNGKLYGLESGFFGLLRFIANLAIGLPYLLGQGLGWGAGDIRSFGFEYGNTFLYTAGLINMLVILDAFDISRGRKG